jgi:hypothetical protein
MNESIKYTRKKIRPSDIPATVSAKWSVTVLDEGFTPFPKRVMRAMHEIFGGRPEGIDELSVILAVADYKRLNLQRLPSIQYLAWTSGLSVESYRAHLEELVKRQLVKRRGSEADLDISLAPFEQMVERLTPDDGFESSVHEF